MSRILLKETPEILHNEGDMALFLGIGHWSLVKRLRKEIEKRE